MKNRICGKRIRIVQILLIVSGLLILFSVNRSGAGAQMMIEGFVYDPCGGCFTENNPCKPCKVMLELEGYIFSELAYLGVEEDCHIQVHNLLYDEQKELLSERLPDDIPEYPVLFLDEEVFCGWEQIEEGFVPAVLARTGREDPGRTSGSVREIHLVRTGEEAVVWFEMSACASCGKTKDYLEKIIPEYENVNLITLDIEDQGNLDLFRAYCRMYDADADTLSVPAVFIGDRYLEGYEEICLFLEPWLEAGYAHDTYCVK